MPQTSANREVKIVLVVVLLVELGLAITAHLFYGPDTPSYEAAVRTGVGADLLAGESRGRQGFIGSLYWAPLPTLFLLPFLAWPLLSKTCLAAALVAAAAMAGACAFLVAWWARCRVNKTVRIAAVILLCASPWSVWAVVGGDGAVLFGLLALAVMALAIRWLERRSLRSLAYLGVVMSLLLLTRFQSVILLAVIFVLILFFLLFQNPESGFRKRWSYSEATFIIFLAPVVYAVLVWVAANWLIMGDAAFFLRGLLPGHWPPDAPRGLLGWFEILRDGCEWRLALVAAVLVGGPWLFGAFANPSRSTSAPASLAVLLVAAALFGFSMTHQPPRLQAQDDKEIADVLDYLIKRHSEDRVVVAGYRGYDLVRRVSGADRDIFVHTLSFYLGSALRDTRGKRLFLLIHRPSGSDRWEDIVLKYPDAFKRGLEFTVFEKGWEEWQLLEVVRTDQ